VLRYNADRVTFFRQAALLLPSAFLLGVFLFLLTHGRNDPAFGVYPFFEEWMGPAISATFPQGRFVEQTLLFFLPLYLVTLLFLLCIALAETALFGQRPAKARSAYSRALGTLFVLLYLPVSAALVLVGDRLARTYAPEALVAPLLAAIAPLFAAPLALVPAAVLAGPLAVVRKVSV
jgi:hypothetical protein